jgi:PncC family amidohydrolase
MRQQELQVRLMHCLTALGQSLSVAESCTGGRLASRITDVPGASSYFLGGIVAYQNAAKVRLLDVPADTLIRHGAVSAETAEAMATGCRGRFSSDLSVGITGIAGPEGGSDDKPVGLVYIAVAGVNALRIERFLFSGDRGTVQQNAVETALQMILSFAGCGQEKRQPRAADAP